MHQIELIISGKSHQEEKSYLFPIPSEFVYLLKTYQAHLRDDLQALIQVEGDHNQTIAVLDSDNVKERDFLWALRSDLIALSDTAGPEQTTEFSGESLPHDYRSKFLADDQETLAKFIEWCEVNHRTFVTLLFDNDFFENQ